MFYFTPSHGFFSPFPHGTCSLSVVSQYLALPDGPGRFPQTSTYSVVLGEITIVFFSTRYLDVSVPWVAFIQPIYLVVDSQTLLWLGCPIRRSTGLRLFPPIRSVSQVVASFIGFLYQGIRHMPLVTYPKFLYTDRFVFS
jgi:hypothetical protein